MKHLYIFDEEDQSLTTTLKEIMKKEKSIKIKNYKIEELKNALINIPDLVVINEDSINIDINIQSN